MALKKPPHPERERSEQSKDAPRRSTVRVLMQSASGARRRGDAGSGERGDLALRVAEFRQHRLGVLAERGDKRFRGGLGVRHAKGWVQGAERAALVLDFGERTAMRELRVVHCLLDRAIGR